MCSPLLSLWLIIIYNANIFTTKYPQTVTLFGYQPPPASQQNGLEHNCIPVSFSLLSPFCQLILTYNLILFTNPLESDLWSTCLDLPSPSLHFSCVSHENPRNVVSLLFPLQWSQDKFSFLFLWAKTFPNRNHPLPLILLSSGPFLSSPQSLNSSTLDCTMSSLCK